MRSQRPFHRRHRDRRRRGGGSILRDPAGAAACPASGTSPLYPAGVVGNLSLPAAASFAPVKRGRLTTSPTGWFVSHLFAGVSGAVLIAVRTAGSLGRPPALMLLALPFLVVQATRSTITPRSAIHAPTGAGRGRARSGLRHSVRRARRPSRRGGISASIAGRFFDLPAEPRGGCSRPFDRHLIPPFPRHRLRSAACAHCSWRTSRAHCRA